MGKPKKQCHNFNFRPNFFVSWCHKIWKEALYIYTEISGSDFISFLQDSLMVIMLRDLYFLNSCDEELHLRSYNTKSLWPAVVLCILWQIAGCCKFPLVASCCTAKKLRLTAPEYYESKPLKSLGKSRSIEEGRTIGCDFEKKTTRFILLWQLWAN